MHSRFSSWKKECLWATMIRKVFGILVYLQLLFRSRTDIFFSSGNCTDGFRNVHEREVYVPLEQFSDTNHVKESVGSRVYFWATHFAKHICIIVVSSGQTRISEQSMTRCDASDGDACCSLVQESPKNCVKEIIRSRREIEIEEI